MKIKFNKNFHILILTKSLKDCTTEKEREYVKNFFYKKLNKKLVDKIINSY